MRMASAWAMEPAPEVSTPGPSSRTGATATRFFPASASLKDGVRDGQTEHAEVSLVSGDYFRVLGTGPLLGRTFTAAADKTPHADTLVVISHGYWKSRFALDPSIVGRKIRINRTMFNIIGVVPGATHFVASFGLLRGAVAMIRQVVAPAACVAELNHDFF
jgi:hypothetical protein